MRIETKQLVKLIQSDTNSNIISKAPKRKVDSLLWQMATPLLATDHRWAVTLEASQG